MRNTLSHLLLLAALSCAAPQQQATSQDDDLAPEGNLTDEKSAEDICEAGAGDMCSALADHHFRKAKTPQQKAKALEYAKKGCDLKDGAGCSLAGWAQEWGTPPDIKAALKSYEAGCAINDGRSCAKAGALLAFGPIGHRERTKALEYATKSCAANDDDGCALQKKLKAEPQPATNNDCDKKGEGALTKQQIGDVIKWHSAEVRDCFDRAVHANPTLTGRVELAWTIDCTGAVTKPAISETTLPKDVATCVLENVKHWHFPAPKGGGTAHVTFPWVLKPKK